ncbi:retrovirus-related pol polyprotein from transposon TNT 1-94 [Tanacetum coccineum]
MAAYAFAAVEEEDTHEPLTYQEAVACDDSSKDNCVYSLDGHAMAGELNASVEEKDSLAQVWHKRLGQISEVGLQVLEKQGLFGKKSLGGYGFISSVKKLRTDNGLEFCNREFEKLCIESRIARHLTVTGMPQQNGVAERMNRTFMDKSGHPSDYGMLRFFGCVAYLYDKQGKLEPRTIKYVLLGYPEGVKGYKLYRLDDESPKIVTSRNVVFNESVMYKDTLKDSSAGDKSVEELQVEVELQRLNNHTPKDDQIDQEDGIDEDARDQETDQPSDLTDYQLAEEEDTHEPLTYQEAVACEDSSKWKAAMKEEMDSLRKNKT